MAANSQQFRSATEPTRRVHGLSSLSLEDKIDKLTNVVQTLLIDKTSPARLCGICAKLDHSTYSCLILHEDSTEQANAVGNFSGPPQRQYDPYSNWYNIGWNDHPNLKAIVQRLVNSTEKFQLKIEMHLQELDKQVSKIALTVSRLESQGKLPSQTKPHPRHNVSAMKLRSGKVLEPASGMSHAYNAGRDEKKLDTEAPVELVPQKSFVVPPLFPGRLVQCKKEREKKEILDIF
ncbi:hypothetical protein CXB51_009150 [Gossypium anomalum]|uniref:Uncharacterized protein n=1 Tax=Gossypium anomalum TaxID=47600 RepID=A0A8J6D5V5_9ROSI|nr:hypothetical protein CXB51_009150 [Gossypium anomalum]